MERADEIGKQGKSAAQEEPISVIPEMTWRSLRILPRTLEVPPSFQTDAAKDIGSCLPAQEGRAGEAGSQTPRSSAPCPGSCRQKTERSPNQEVPGARPAPGPPP